MKYEVHITVESSSFQQANDFAASSVCSRPEHKALLIELHNPQNKPTLSSPTQLMLAAKIDEPNDDRAKCMADNMADELRAYRWDVKRVKLESALMPGEAEYYECHWKLDMHVDYEWQYAQLCTFLSKNPHYLRSKNLFDIGTYFLSARSYRVKNTEDDRKAGEHFNHLGYALSMGEHNLVKTHYERVIWDSNPSLDYGWSEV